MKILLVGGGSGGPVAPLLAVATEMKNKNPKAQFLLVGTKNGPEEQMAERAGIKFTSISSGKLRRYFSIKNFLSPFFIGTGFFQSLKILKEFKPDLVFGAGSYVQVPLVWAAKIKNIPVVLHQQDVSVSLANKLCQFAATRITVTFESSLKSFSSSFGIFYKKHKHEKVVLTGNPFRGELKNGTKENAIKEFNLKADFPTVLILGGGTGANFLNKLTAESLDQLTKSVQIIHSTGKGKQTSQPQENYHPYEFINNMADAYAAADIVVARAGLSTLTELSNLRKLSIIIPMPNSHQEINALMLMRYQAAVVLDQEALNPKNFTNLIRKFLFASQTQKLLKENIGRIMPHSAAEKISEIILKTIQEHNAR